MLEVKRQMSEYARDILENVISAINTEPGDSVLLLHESVNKGFEVYSIVCVSGITMMMSFSATERTESF